MIHACELCGNPVESRIFVRRSFPEKRFCSIVCIDAFEVRSGLPSGRVYETRPGWSAFPAVAQPPAALCS